MMEKSLEQQIQLEKLIEQAQNKGKTPVQAQEAFAHILPRFSHAAVHWARAVLGDAQLADDAVQEAAIIAYEKIGQLRRPAAFSTWYKRIVVSQCHRLLRQQRFPLTEWDESTQLVDSERDPVRAVEQNELRDRVWTAVETLPPKEKVVTDLFYLKGYSQKEIAGLLELPLTTVKKRLQYARSSLRPILLALADSVLGPSPVPPPAPAVIPVVVAAETPYHG